MNSNTIIKTNFTFQNQTNVYKGKVEKNSYSNIDDMINDTLEKKE